MDSVSWVALGVGAVTIFFSVIGFFLTQQGKMIDQLFVKHDEDADRLNRFELKVAELHYQKPEVDKVLDRFKGYFDERFDRLEKAIAHGRSN